VPQNQLPQPIQLTPPPKDLVTYNEKRKFDDGIMEDFPPEKKQRLQNFPLANGIDFHTDFSCEDFRIIYPIHEPKAVMESVYQNGIWFVKNERKVHFGFSMNPLKIQELNAKGLELCCLPFLSMAGVHNTIKACAKHDKVCNGNFFSTHRLDQVFPGSSPISIPLTHNNDDFSMALYFHCSSSCLTSHQRRNLRLNFAFFLRSVKTHEEIPLKLRHRRNIKIVSNPGRDAGICLKKRPNPEDYADPTSLTRTIVSLVPQKSQQDVKRALQSIPISDTRFYFRLQRAFERVIRFETSEYHIALIESSYQYST